VEHQAIIDRIDSGVGPAAQEAVRTNWRNAAERLSGVIGRRGERGAW
jgi:DNA-binding GntR family transcriptional regulator